MKALYAKIYGVHVRSGSSLYGHIQYLIDLHRRKKSPWRICREPLIHNGRRGRPPVRVWKEYDDGGKTCPPEHS